MYRTANTLPEQIRSRSVALLNRHRAAAIDLHAQVNNVAEAMQGVPRKIVERQLGHFAKADRRYAEGVAHALRMTLSQAAE